VADEAGRFGPGEIRRWMDVYTFDGTHLGNVLLLDLEEDPAMTPKLADPVKQSSSISGESLGPAPTTMVGNPGPVRQSAAYDYANHASGTAFVRGRFLVGKYNGLMGLRWIDLEDVQTVALERIVLHRREQDLD
jgi:hypothetical protein